MFDVMAFKDRAERESIASKDRMNRERSEAEPTSDKQPHESPTPPTIPADVLYAICLVHKITAADFHGRDRKHHLTEARAMVAYFLRHEYKWSHARIATVLNYAQGCVVTRRVQRAQDLLDTDPNFRRQYGQVLSVAKSVIADMINSSDMRESYLTS